MFSPVKLARPCWPLFLLIALACAQPVTAQKEEVWTEIRSPNFIVVSNGGEKLARRVADQFEQFRATFQRALPRARVDLGKPLVIFAAKNEKTLRTLLPAYWERKGSVHPVGVFLPGEEKLYVALRTDAVGETPYGVVYHEYIHALVNLNFETIPVWLNEGFAEYYANTVLGNKTVGLGRPDSNSVLFLRQEKLLPLDVLFAVDHKSPHYNERNKASIFYAQSWALIHYFMVEDWKAEKKRLGVYMDLLFERVEPTEAARRAFGDLKALEKALARYVQRNTFQFFELKAPAEIDEAAFPMRALSPAESAALRGDFYVRTRRPQEARALLEEAIRLDPQNALAHESIGLLHLWQNDVDAASEWFDKAARFDSQSYMALYFSAMMGVRRNLASGNTDEIEARLTRVIQLNPQFAPAHSTLASLYTFREETRDKALVHAKRAMELEPGVLAHRINLASVLLRMERMDEAIAMARSAQDSAASPEELQMVSAFLTNAERYKESLAARAAWDAGQARRQNAVAEEPEPEPTDPATPPPLQRRVSKTVVTGPPVNPPKQEIVSLPATPANGILAEGLAAVVTCAPPSVLAVTLDFGGITIKLAAEDRSKVQFSRKGGDLPAGFNPCTGLRGKQVAIAYIAKAGDGVGQIISIEVQ